MIRNFRIAAYNGFSSTAPAAEFGQYAQLGTIERALDLAGWWNWRSADLTVLRTARRRNVKPSHSEATFPSLSGVTANGAGYFNQPDSVCCTVAFTNKLQ
jgi:hypothetical protein